MTPIYRTSAAGIADIGMSEGEVYEWYYDEAHIGTGGMGHRWVKGDPPFILGGPISRAQVDAWKANDLRVTESCLNSLLNRAIGQNMFDALVSLGFNIGTMAERHSTVIRILNTGGGLLAADAFLQWNKVSIGGKLVVSANLTARRSRERAIFLRDVSTLDDGP